MSTAPSHSPQVLCAGYLNKLKTSDFGWLTGTFNRRFFVLDRTALQYFESQAAMKAKIPPSGVLAVRNLISATAVVTQPGLLFDVVTVRAKVTLQAASEAERSKWVSVLQGLADQAQKMDKSTAPSKFFVSGYCFKYKSSEFGSMFGEWNERFFTFNGKYLMYAVNAKGGFGSTKIPFADIISIESHLQNQFLITTSKRVYRLKVDSEITRKNWLTQIGNAIAAREEKLKKAKARSQEEAMKYVDMLIKEAHLDEEGKQDESESETQIEESDECEEINEVYEPGDVTVDEKESETTR